MKLNEIKTRIEKYSDFYGGDIPDVDKIRKCKNKKECRLILDDYYRFLEDQNLDALKHLDNFIKDLGLSFV